MRVIIYTDENGQEETFSLPTVEDEQHERTYAEREHLNYRIENQEED